MEKLFVPVIVKREFDYDKIISELNKLKGSFAICYSNQFVDVANEIFQRIKNRISIKLQILGCSSPKFPSKTDFILFVGEGEFHSVSLAYESKLPTYNLIGNKLEKVDSKKVLKMEKKERGNYLKYLNSRKIGVLVSLKPGQERFKRALEFKKKSDKKCYLFLGNNLNPFEFENYGIDCWVNSACPRMDLEGISLININKLEK